MNINYLMRRAALLLTMGSVMFLFSCNDDDENPSLPDAPVAGFTTSVDGATVTFTNTTTGEVDTYAWDFGDGTTSSAETPTPKSYTETGSYDITLTVTNEGGQDRAEETVMITVAIVDEEAPVITLEGDDPLCLNIGDMYSDPGVTVTDNVDAELTATVGGDVVDMTTAGSYVVTYDATDAAGNEAVQVTRTVIVSEVFSVEGNLITNGSFDDGETGWTANYEGGPEIRTEGCNSFFYAEVGTAGDAFAVNLSYILEITNGATYRLTFDASTDQEAGRTIIAGIGLNEDPFTATTEIVSLTTETQTFTYDLTAGFGLANSRVLFDMGAATGVVVIDNVSLVLVDEGGGGGSDAAPTDAPTTPPERDAADVISIYGEAYGTAIGFNNVDWDEGSDSAEETHAGNNVLKLSFNTFLGLDLGSEVDASGMTHAHMDIWVADEFAAGQVFLPKWSNHNGAAETDAFEYTYAVGGDDSQKWISIDVALADWNNVNGSGADARANLKQLVIGVAATLDVVYLDNVYFYNDGTGSGGSGGGGGGGSTDAAPTDAPTPPPARDAADVISIYGDAYGTAIGLNNVSWDEGSEATVETHADNNVLKLSFETFLGTDLGSEVDASGMTHIHMDFWIADEFAAGQVFLPKWSNHNGDAETDAFEYTYAVGGDDSQKWLSIDVPISDWNNVNGSGPDARANLKQLVIGVSATLDVVYMDNVYFYKE